jgi:hypothetical protein
MSRALSTMDGGSVMGNPRNGDDSGLRKVVSLHDPPSIISLVPRRSANPIVYVADGVLRKGCAGEVKRRFCHWSIAIRRSVSEPLRTSFLYCNSAC